MNVTLRRVANLCIRDTRCLHKTPSSSRTSQSVGFTLSSDASNERAYWRQYPLQRFYSHSLKSAECWHCQSRTKTVDHFICDTCGRLQDISKEYDYFKLLSLPPDFDVPLTDLTKSFRRLQTLVHPDKFSNKSEREKRNSADWSALINKAYKTLSQPIIRGQYLLKLQGEDMPNDNSTTNKEFLMEMMERNEEVDDANSAEDLNNLNDKVQEEINAEVVELKQLFNSNDLEGAKRELVRMKYLLSIQNSIKTKLEKLIYK